MSDPFDDPDDVPEIGADMLHRSRVDFEKGMKLFPPVTLALMAACVLGFAIELANGALESEEAIIRAGALAAPKVASGEFWRLGSAVFLHGGAEHLIGNLVMLYILGIGCEHGFGRGQFLGLFAFAGLTGSAASLLGGNTSVGASGAIFGLAGAMVVFFARHHRFFRVHNHQVGWVLAIWAPYQIYLGMRVPGIDNWAHAGGLLGGAAAALVMDRAVVGGTGGDLTRPVPAAFLGFSVLFLGYTAVGWLLHLLG